MALKLTPYILPYVVAAAISAALFVRLWDYRDRRGARGFLFDTAGIVLISVIYVLQLVSTSPGAKAFWWNWRFVPIAFMAIGYMLMAVEYTNRERYVTTPMALGIVAVPAVTQVLVWTNASHGLVYDYAVAAGTNLFVPAFGPAYWVFAGTMVAYLAIGVYVLLQLSRRQAAFRRQAAILVGTITLVVAGEVVWWLGLVPVDPLPLTSTVKVAGFLYGVARFELLDIVPVARNKIIENMRDAVFVVDRGGYVVDANHAGMRLVDDPDPLRKRVEDVFETDALRTAAAAGPEGHEGREITLSVDGEQRHFDFRVDALYDDAGVPGGRLFVLRDITPLKRREEELAILNRIVRHDIRNDMAVIEGRSELLADHVDPAGAEHLAMIQGSSEHVVELTENVRTLLSSILEDETVETEPTDAAAIVETQLAQARQRFDDATFELDGDLPATCHVEANGMLSSVFTNLFNNAVQHGDKETTRVTVGIDRTDDSVRITVADNGPGVPADRREELFGRGVKGLDSAGTGVGLYLVDRLVDHYGGTVTVGDNDPEGAVYTVELPLATQHQPAVTG
jgi:signal transduction histidine kinase